MAAILLLTKNGCRYLRESLPRVRAEAALYPCEVLAIDSGSSDGTLDLLSGFGVRCYRIEPGRFHHGRTRNLAASLVSPSVEWLVYLTQDATPEPGWLAPLIEAVREDPRVAGAFSRHVPRPGCSPLLGRLITSEWTMAGTGERVVKEISDSDEFRSQAPYYAYFSNTSSCIRRSVWQRYPFSETVEFGEDADWALRVLQAGYRLVYEPRSAVRHSHDYTLWNQFRQTFDHSLGMKRVLEQVGFRVESRWGLGLVKQVGQEWLKDCRYIWYRCDSSVAMKAIWMLYSPLWHLARRLGEYLGYHSDRLPEAARRRLSYQAKVKAHRWHLQRPSAGTGQ